ncbi:MAG: ABC transporter substrate-binding protein [Pseudomonadota bacterium]
MKKLLLGSAMALALVAAPASAKTFKWAFQGDVQSLDPHGLNETFTLGYLGNVYEGLTRYDSELQLQPGLAESWENTAPNTWIFKLRQGVTFHNGNPFTADDVIFSWQRSLTEGSDMKAYGAKIAEATKIDDHTVEITTPNPNPILPRDLQFLYMMDKEWAEENGATEATSPQAGDETATFAAQNANGTGPFVVIERQADVKSVFERSDSYWGSPKTNVTRIEFTPISQAATRVAALISGQVDLVYPVPVQDWQRLEDADGVEPLTGPEARTVFLGMDQSRDELLYSNIKGTNPFKDIRVRQAFAHAISLDAINDKVMRGAATPTGLLVAPQINGFAPGLNTPYAYDAEKAKALLAEAGYPDGFEVGMDCPNNRYVNDERICQAVAGFLARVGIKVDLNAQPKSKYFAKVLAQNNYDTSFYLLGWTPGTIDSHNPLNNLLSCQDSDAGMGLFNLGNYCNERVVEITKLVEGETDPAKRQALIDEGFKIVKDEYGYLPLHQQPLSWGIRTGLDVAQRPDNVLDFRNVVMP